jgi:hypothetical protein
MNNKVGVADYSKLTLPDIVNKDATLSSSNVPEKRSVKFGQVDQNMLMSRLYSTPFNKATSNQKYMLDMGATSIQKPRIKKIETQTVMPEPIVSYLFFIIS